VGYSRRDIPSHLLVRPPWGVVVLALLVGPVLVVTGQLALQVAGAVLILGGLAMPVVRLVAEGEPVPEKRPIERDQLAALAPQFRLPEDVVEYQQPSPEMRRAIALNEDQARFQAVISRYLEAQPELALLQSDAFTMAVLPLSEHVKSALRAVHLVTVKDVLRTDPEALLSVPGIGPRELIELREALERSGFLPNIAVGAAAEGPVDHDLVMHVGLWRDERRGAASQQASA